MCQLPDCQNSRFPQFTSLLVSTPYSKHLHLNKTSCIYLLLLHTMFEKDLRNVAILLLYYLPILKSIWLNIRAAGPHDSSFHRENKKTKQYEHLLNNRIICH
jgi:hypothetical protein